MDARIIALDTFDVRFPTSLQFDGSDAMHPDPDYSVAYVVLRTDATGGNAAEGHGFCFTLGRGTEIAAAAIEALRPFVVGRDLDTVFGDLGGFARLLVGDPQLRWLGPEKGVIHMAASAVINAVWDLYAKIRGEPLWHVLSAMTAEQIVSLVDFRYLTDALTPAEALELLRRAEPGRARRKELLRADGYPAYTTSPGWLGYEDAKLAELARAAVAAGFNQIKLKVGADLEDDIRRCRIARDAVGPDVRIALDANQVWSVDEAIAWLKALAEFSPYWIEEPTSTDDVLGHAAIRRAIEPIKVATGEQVANRIMFKQLLQAGAVDVIQIDACRVGGVNENIAILLLAAKYGVPISPHAGGVGLCELVQHLAMFDYIAVSGSDRDRAIEYVDHLHEHFVHPVQLRDGRYLPPTAPGFSAAMRPDSLARFSYPAGEIWAAGAKRRWLTEAAAPVPPA
jgi:L-fuconate dehydratase